MADVEIQISPEPDVEMAGEEEEDLLDVDDGDIGGPAGEENGNSNPQTIFLDYLKSPIVELVVGSADEATRLTAHSAILTKSPYFADLTGDVSGGTKTIELEEEHIDAVGCFLQYQYTGEYFPRRSTTSSSGLEHDPTVPDLDDTGDQLLKHARVYTLAGKLGLPDLKTLAHSKIHRVNSSARGEIAYARYVYGNTPADDITIRKPVAAFWATRSHVLRHEAEKEFRDMCIQYPQFGFDVLTLVLDQREKRSAKDEETPGKASARKRARTQL